mmetsp:Transcript_19139/g.45073  ORF Transcript_19139/g.45073 Transcript_19139/m.45073 type:complete len:404 (+) Transcript_19139:514-1725(+)
MSNFKPKKHMEEDDGPSRKVAPGGGGAGISFAPMMAPMSSPFENMSSMNTRPGKAAAMTAPVQTSSAAPSSSNTSQFQWQLDSVPTLPEFHPLERTAVFCETATAAQIASRVSTVLRQLSVEASYNDEKARVRCTSASGVEFRVRLYRGRGPEYRHGVIVEVQRRFGYSIDFHDITQAILDAAQGLPTAAAVKRVALSNSSNVIPMVSDAEDEDYSPPPPPSSDGSCSSLKMIAKMFANRGYDTYYLGLQTLASLTDPARMGAATAQSVSKELLNPDNEVGETLVDLIVKKQGQDDEDNVFNLRVMALSIMANALEAVKDEQPALSPVLYELLRPVWIEELKGADSPNLLAAQHAARCVEYTWKQDHDAGELQDALEVAQEVGQARHAGLERQARKTLDNLII